MDSEYAQKVLGIRASGNAHQIKIALRRPLVAEGCFIGGVSLEHLSLDELSVDLMQQVVSDIEAGKLTDPLPIYAPVPTNYDPGLAPPGKQLILASVYGPVRDDPVDPPERWRERGLSALAAMIPGLMDEIEFVEFVPVHSLGRWMGKGSNGAICNGQYPGQVGRDRLGVETPVSGVFLCGDGAGGRGIGTELAASSALQAVEAIERYQSIGDSHSHGHQNERSRLAAG
jgi:prolycopene isomerase